MRSGSSVLVAAGARIYRFTQHKIQKNKIQTRMGPINNLCPVCRRYNEDEDGGHCFFQCKPVRKCLLELGLNNLREELVVLQSSREVVTVVTKILSLEETCTNVMFLLWKWWSVPNAVRGCLL